MIFIALTKVGYEALSILARKLTLRRVMSDRLCQGEGPLNSAITFFLEEGVAPTKPSTQVKTLPPGLDIVKQLSIAEERASETGSNIELAIEYKKLGDASLFREVVKELRSDFESVLVRDYDEQEAGTYILIADAFNKLELHDEASLVLQSAKQVLEKGLNLYKCADNDDGVYASLKETHQKIKKELAELEKYIKTLKVSA